MREDITKKIEGLVDEVCKMTGNAKEAKVKIEEMLSLQKQNDIVATELAIPEDEVVRRYQFDETMEIVKCKTCIFFHATCFWVVARPTLAEDGGSLYETLNWFCEYQDSRAELSEMERETGDAYCSIIAHMLALPRDLFYDTHLCIDIATYAIRTRADYYTKLLEQASREETAEDLLENQRFEKKMEITQDVVAGLDKMAKKKRRKS